MAFEMRNFVIDHVLRGYMLDKSGNYMWSINQITDPSLSITSETEQAVDALGTPIATFNRGKEAEFSAENSIFDLGLFAAQNGTSINVAETEKTIVAPMFEEIEANGGTSPIFLKHKPNANITEIYELKGDGTLSTVYTVTTGTPGDGQFAYSAGNNAKGVEVGKIVLPEWSAASGTDPSTGVAKGTKFFVRYDYEATEAVEVKGTAKDFPKQGRFIMEVLGTDTCDTTKLVYAYLDFPNAKLDAEVDVSFTTDGTHPFTLVCQQDYCDYEKVLYRLVIPNEQA